MADCRRCLATLAFLARSEQISANLEIPRSLVAKAGDLVESRRLTSAQTWRWAPLATAMTLVLVVSWAHLHTREQPYETANQSPLHEQQQSREAQPIPNPPEPSPPATFSRDVRSSNAAKLLLQIVAPREGETVSARGAEIVWTAVPNAIFYEVEVVSDDGAMIWHGRVEGTTVAIPRSLELQSQVRHFVSVRVQLSDGRVLKSRAVGFLPKVQN